MSAPMEVVPEFSRDEAPGAARLFLSVKEGWKRKARISIVVQRMLHTSNALHALKDQPNTTSSNQSSPFLKLQVESS